MALPADKLPRLRVIDGRRNPVSRSEEAHIELLTLFAEVESAAAVIVNAAVGLPVPSMVIVNEANRMALRVQLARDEYLSLTGGDAA